MSDQELIEFANEVLGIFITPDTRRTKIMTIIFNAAVAVKDGI